MDVGQGNSATDSQLHSGYDDSQMLSQQTQQTAIHDPQPELATASQQPLRSCGSTEPGQPTVNRGIQPPSRDLGDSLVSQKDSYITVPNLAKVCENAAVCFFDAWKFCLVCE